MTATPTANEQALRDFSAAFGRGDVDAIMALMTDDCAFEATSPAPDGERVEGADAVRAVWESLFNSTADAAFCEEESFVAGDRAVLRWRFTWSNADGSAGHVRGVDVLRMRDGKVAEKLSYVKG
jgi:ketosteroid isomerase-like protein